MDICFQHFLLFEGKIWHWHPLGLQQRAKILLTIFPHKLLKLLQSFFQTAVQLEHSPELTYPIPIEEIHTEHRPTSVFFWAVLLVHISVRSNRTDSNIPKGFHLSNAILSERKVQFESMSCWKLLRSELLHLWLTSLLMFMVPNAYTWDAS